MNVRRSQEDYITEVSEEIEGRVTKKLSKKFSRTKNCILGALACHEDFLMNPLIQGRSGKAPETSQNALSTSYGRMRTTHRRSSSWSRHLPQPDDVKLWRRRGPRHGDRSLRGLSYCSPSTSLGEQKKNRSTSQPQFRSENSPATIEADQIFVGPSAVGKSQKFCKLS